MREYRVRDEAQSREAARVQECKFTSFPSNFRWRQLEHADSQISVCPMRPTTCSTVVSSACSIRTYLGWPQELAVVPFSEIDLPSVPGWFLTLQLVRQLARHLGPPTWIIPVMPKCMTGSRPSPERVIQNLTCLALLALNWTRNVLLPFAFTSCYLPSHNLRCLQLSAPQISPCRLTNSS